LPSGLGLSGGFRLDFIALLAFLIGFSLAFWVMLLVGWLVLVVCNCLGILLCSL
jgi:hypothetical protein